MCVLWVETHGPSVLPKTPCIYFPTLPSVSPPEASKAPEGRGVHGIEEGTDMMVNPRLVTVTGIGEAMMVSAELTIAQGK